MAKIKQEVQDYNGTGAWAVDAVLQRYQHYASQLGIQPIDISPQRIEQGAKVWVYPVMDPVIKVLKPVTLPVYASAWSLLSRISIFPLVSC